MPRDQLPRLVVRLLGALALGTVLAGCGTLSGTAPAPTAADFPGIATDISHRGIALSHIVSGDAGCSDGNLAKTAIAFDASGLDQSTPVRVYVYIFRNRATYERLRSTVDACARAYVTDPATFESLETSPYVVTGQGPWASRFRDSIRAAITEAAGTGD